MGEEAAEVTAVYFQVEGRKCRVRRLLVLYFPWRKGFILWEGGITDTSDNLIFFYHKFRLTSQKMHLYKCRIGTHHQGFHGTL